MPDNLNAPAALYRSEFEAAIVQHALADGAFWNALVQDATAALAQYFSAQGKTMPSGLTVTAKAEDAQTFYHVIADPAYFAPSLGSGTSSLNPRESFHSRTDYLLTRKEGDPSTVNQTTAQLQAALTAAQLGRDDASSTFNEAQAQAVQSAQAVNLARADLQDAQFAAKAAAAAVSDDPDNTELAALSAQAADAETQAQAAYDQAASLSVQAQNSVVMAGSAYETASATLDAAQRALFQANFALDPVLAASQSFNTSMPFVTAATAQTKAQADASLQSAQAQAHALATASEQASQDAVQAARNAAQSPDDTSLQALADATAQSAAQAASDAASAAANVAETAKAAGAATVQAHGVNLLLLDEAADGTFYLVLPYAPHQSAFMGPYSLQLADGAYAIHSVPTPALMPVDRMAVEVWMQSPGFDAARQDVLVSLGNANAGWQIDCCGGRVTLVCNLIANEVATTCRVQQPSNLPLLNPGCWHYIAGVYDGQTVQLYVDGRWVAQTPASGTLVPFGGCLVIGRNADLQDDHSYFNGLLHEVRLWGDALTPSQIADNRNQGQDPVGFAQAALAHFEFNDGAGTAAVDSTSHHYDLSLQFGATWQSTGLRSPG